MTPVSGTDDSDLPVSDLPIIAEFRPNLSELNSYIGDLKGLQISSNAFQYSPSTPPFTDYSQKQRIIALPGNTKMQF